jgi:hypothetical protein
MIAGRLRAWMTTRQLHLLPVAGHLNTNYCNYLSQGEIIGLFAGALGFGADFRKLTDEQKGVVRECITAYRQIRHLLNHDYYPLFPQSMTTQTWNAWQFFDPKRQEGSLILYRPADSPYRQATLRLRSLLLDREYVFEELLTGESFRKTGDALIQGIDWALEPGQGQVWQFRAD